MKCAKCGEHIHCTGLGGAPLPTLCDKCTYDDSDSADFRAFRRQVLISIVSGEQDNILWENDDYLKTMWTIADRIARAEPKE